MKKKYEQPTEHDIILSNETFIDVVSLHQENETISIDYETIPSVIKFLQECLDIKRAANS